MANLKSTETKNPITIYKPLIVLDSPSSSTSTLQNDNINEKAHISNENNNNNNSEMILSSTPSTPSSPSVSKKFKSINIQDTLIDKRGNPAACIFVASLNKSKTDEELNLTVYKHFEKWGKLVNVKVFKDWKERPYAFVQFERVCDAKIALEEAHGTVIDNRSIRCESARVNRTLCLTILQLSLKKEDIYKELSIFGPIEDINFTISHNTSFCYVRYHYRDDAIRAYLTLQTSIYNSQWTVEWTANINVFDNQIVRYDRTCVYVGNVAKSVKREDLKIKFEKYGIILNVTLIKRDEPYFKTTFAFIKYSGEKEARAATEYENGQTWFGNIIYVSLREIRPYGKILNKLNKNKNNNNQNKNNKYNKNQNTNTRPTKVVWTTKDGHYSYQQNKPHPPGLNIPAASFYPYHIPVTMYTSSAPPITTAATTTTSITNTNKKQVTFADKHDNNNDDENQNNMNDKNNHHTKVNNSTIYNQPTPIYTPTPFFATPSYYKPTTTNATGLNYNTYYLSNGNNSNLYHYGYCDSSMNPNYNIMLDNPSNMVAYSPLYYYCYYPNHLSQEYPTAITPLYNSYYQMYPHAETLPTHYMFTSPIPDTSNSSFNEDSSITNNNKKTTIHEIDQDKDPNCTADTTDDDVKRDTNLN